MNPKLFTLLGYVRLAWNWLHERFPTIVPSQKPGGGDGGLQGPK